MKRRTTKKATAKTRLSSAMNISEIEMVLTALFYGRSGTGKTTLAGTFPGKKLLLDVGERGTDSLAGQKDVFSLQVKEWDDYEDFYWELVEPGHGFDTVIVDAQHSLQSLAIDKAKKNAGKKLAEQTSQRDFGQAGAMLTQWNFSYRDLRDQGINVVFLAHDRVFEFETEEEDSGVIMPEVGPRLMPAVSSALTGMVNVVGNTFIREEVTRSKKAGQKSSREIQYCLRIGPHGYYTTKIRKPKEYSLPEYIVDPTYDKLVDVIKGTTPETSPKRKLRRRR